tara:strand:- start:2860 stop:3000 length:141 start_codon:yes stop_codon:yes gene_type:complete
MPDLQSELQKWQHREENIRTLIHTYPEIDPFNEELLNYYLDMHCPE